jgi:hypothetical protein
MYEPNTQTQEIRCITYSYIIWITVSTRFGGPDVGSVEFWPVLLALLCLLLQTLNEGVRFILTTKKIVNLY